MSNEEGFTLVELLFAMVAGSLLLIVLGWAVRGLGDELQRHGRVGPAEQVEAATPFLQAMIGHAIPPGPDDAIVTRPDDLWLVVPPPAALDTAGPVRLDLAVAHDARGASLVARMAPTRGKLPAAAVQPGIIAGGFRDIRFVYDRGRNDPPGSLPRLVTILFTARDGVLLPLGVEPRLSEGAACVFDPISQSCRR